MRYFECKEPYYALIMAVDESHFLEIYDQKVSSIEDKADEKEVMENTKEITEIAAWNLFKEGQSEDGIPIPTDELEADFGEKIAKVLLVDSQLV